MQAKDLLIIGIDFAQSFDMMDFTSLIGCIQSDSDVWKALFYIALICSSLLLAVEINKEENFAQQIAYHMVTLVISDLLFLTVRVHIMVRENSIQTGFHFVLRAGITAIFRICLMIWFCCKA